LKLQREIIKNKFTPETEREQLEKFWKDIEIYTTQADLPSVALAEYTCMIIIK
jgi:hypothetical protein